MTEVLPRVWVGGRIVVNNWSMLDGRWGRFFAMEFCEVFVPGDQPKPTINPADMKSLETCKEIDWT